MPVTRVTSSILGINPARGRGVESRDAVTDGEIVRAVLAGDVDLYAVLVERYRDRFARYATRMLGSRDAAEDALQDALVRAFDRLADCREPEKFAGWLFLILRNRCFAEHRRHQREERLPEAAVEAVRDPDVAAAQRAHELHVVIARHGQGVVVLDHVARDGRRHGRVDSRKGNRAHRCRSAIFAHRRRLR